MQLTRSAIMATAAGYLIGSIPNGVLVGKLSRGIDVRASGSGSMGTTNVLRVIGHKEAAAVFVLDVAKGAVAVAVADMCGATERERAVAAAAAMIGHSYPCFADFHGGKSVATAFGGMLMVAPGPALCGACSAMAALAVTRTMSVASLTGAGGAIAGATAWHMRHQMRSRKAAAGLLFSVSAASIILWRHRANIKRIVNNEEPQIGEALKCDLPGTLRDVGAGARSRPQGSPASRKPTSALR